MDRMRFSRQYCISMLLFILSTVTVKISANETFNGIGDSISYVAGDTIPALPPTCILYPGKSIHSWGQRNWILSPDSSHDVISYFKSWKDSSIAFAIQVEHTDKGFLLVAPANPTRPFAFRFNAYGTCTEFGWFSQGTVGVNKLPSGAWEIEATIKGHTRITDTAFIEKKAFKNKSKMTEEHDHDHGEGELIAEETVYNNRTITIYYPAEHNCHTCPDCSVGHFVINCPICYGNSGSHECPICHHVHEWHQCPACAACHTDEEHTHDSIHDCREEHEEHHCSICAETHPGDPHDCPICHYQSDCLKAHEMMAVSMEIDGIEVHLHAMPTNRTYMSHYISFSSFGNPLGLAIAIVDTYPDLDFSSAH